VNDYLARWFEGLPALRRNKSQSGISVTGKCDRHYGGHSAYAQIKVRFEPASQFEVSETAPEIKFRITTRAQYAPEDFAIPEGYLPKLLDQANFGLLDTFMPNEQAPGLVFRIVLEEIEYCPINSSEMAFRIAARDAGERMIEVWKASRRQSV
jgi:hypothetical protein